MSDQATPAPTPAEIVTEDLRGYADQLVTGAPEKLGPMWSPLAKLTPERRAEEIAKRIASPLVDRYRDPAYDGSQVHPVEAAIRAQAPKLRDGAVGELTQKWSAELAVHSDPVRLAGEVARRLNNRDNWDYLRVKPEAPAHEDRVYNLLSANFGDVLTVNGKMAMARERGREFSRMSDQQIIGIVANSLRSPVVAKRYGGEATIANGDHRLAGQGERTTPATTRDSGGRFKPAVTNPQPKTTPTPKPETPATRRRPSF